MAVGGRTDRSECPRRVREARDTNVRDFDCQVNPNCNEPTYLMWLAGRAPRLAARAHNKKGGGADGFGSPDGSEERGQHDIEVIIVLTERTSTANAIR